MDQSTSLDVELGTPHLHGSGHERGALWSFIPTKNVQVFIAAYGAYALMPIVVMLRVANAPLFGKTKQN
eukprot:Em0114g4a